MWWCNFVDSSGLNFFFFKKKNKIDIDECEANPPLCNEFATCENSIGSFSCTCKEGYSGDGKVCALSEKNKNNRAVGIGVGVTFGLLALIILVLLVFFFLRRKVIFFFKKKKDKQKHLRIINT